MRLPLYLVQGSFSFDDGSEKENVTQKMNLRCFTLIPSHSMSLMLANFPGVEFQKTISKFRKKNQIVFLSSRLS